MDILDRLVLDHVRLAELSDELDREVLARWEHGRPVWGAEAVARVLGLVHRLVELWSEHDELERSALYPELLRRAPLGPERVIEIESERAKVSSLLSDFSLELARSHERPTTWMLLNLMRLTSLIQRHAALEEGEIFPLARQHLADLASGAA